METFFILVLAIIVSAAIGGVLIWIFGILRGTITWFVSDLILGAALLVGAATNLWVSLIIFIILMTLFIWNGIGNVPAYPPQKAILVFLGKRLKEVLDEGYHWFPVYPLLFTYIRVTMLKVPQDLEPQKVRTPDLAQIEVRANIVWVPGNENIKDSDQKNYADSLITYLNCNGGVGVKQILTVSIEDRLRTWAASNNEGPSDWFEATALKSEAVEVLLRAIVGEDILPKVPSGIPTTAWLKFFAEPKQKPSQNEIDSKWATGGRERDGKWDWGGLKTIFDVLPDRASRPQKEAGNGGKKDIQEAIETRREEIKKAQRGDASFFLKSLGITLQRFTVQEIKVTGKTEEAAELEKKEKHERAADAVEIQNVVERIKELQALGLSAQEAVDIVQTERSGDPAKKSKVVKTIDVKKIDLSQQTIEGLQKIAETILDKIVH